MPRLLPSDARSTAMQISAGRALIAASILAAPQRAARSLGADSATAGRVTWLTRMMGVRDAALGAGGVAALRGGGDARLWLLGGAVSDAVDALALGAALRQGRVRGPLPALVVLGAAGAAAYGAVTAGRLGRG